MDITQERLRREFGVEVVATAPSVPYRAYLNNGAMLEINSPQKMPALDVLKYVEELFVKVHIFQNPNILGD
jgi:GTP-binding protein LepA